MTDMTDLKGRIAMVTGASQEFGLAISKAFALAGAHVAALDETSEAAKSAADAIVRSLSTEPQQAGDDVASVVPVSADMSSVSSIEEAVRTVEKRFGRIDILVNASETAPTASFLETDRKMWERTIDHNMRASFFCARTAMRSMVSRGAGRIINLSSVNAHQGFARTSAYSASKAGLEAFSRVLAVEGGEAGVLTNNVVAGPIGGAGTQGLSADEEDAFRGQRIPLKRFGKGSDVANACLFFASPDTTWSTGASIRVDGGLLGAGRLPGSLEGLGVPEATQAPEKSVPETDRVAVVTGAGQGLGRQVAERFAQSGLAVVVVDWKGAEAVAEQMSSDGYEVMPYTLDVRDESAVNDMVDKAVERYGHIDVLGNIAAWRSRAYAVEETGENWDKIVSICATGYFIVGQAVARKMVESGRGGRIVNVSSTATFMGLDRTSSYAAAKGAVDGLTRVMAVELAPYGITANVIAPGNIRSKAGVTTSFDLAKVLARTPVGHSSYPDDIAVAIEFLASPAARYVTGQLFAVDGGYSAYGAGP
jgi:NAD(P)-dependent dehydrogenase (short-subunit alcohol dehydrogenase family)